MDFTSLPVVLTIPTIVPAEGFAWLAVLLEDAAPDPTEFVIGAGPRVNQISAYTEYSSTVDIAGVTYAVWFSNLRQDQILYGENFEIA